jgi:hypothetical protein
VGKRTAEGLAETDQKHVRDRDRDEHDHERNNLALLMTQQPVDPCHGEYADYKVQIAPNLLL